MGMPGMVMTLEISNMDKIYIFGTLMALASGIIWHMQMPSLPKSLVSVPPFYLDFTNFNSNFVFFEKIVLGSDGFGQNWI